MSETYGTDPLSEERDDEKDQGIQRDHQSGQRGEQSDHDGSQQGGQGQETSYTGRQMGDGAESEQAGSGRDPNRDENARRKRPNQAEGER